MSGTVRVFAKKLNDGRECEIKNITNLRILASIDSPAVSLSVSSAPGIFYEDVGEVYVLDGGKRIFEGKTDSQIAAVSSDGVTMRLEARSAGGLLLDNQACPCVLMDVRLSTVFNRFIAPYGFSLYAPRSGGYIPTYTVRAGMSEWDVLVGFSQRIYSVTPYVNGSQIMLDRPSSAKPLTLSNSGEGIKFSSLRHIRTPYNIVSQVVLRDENGRYEVGVNNSAAARTKTRRKRYAVPGTEYAQNLSLDANRRVRRSMFEYERIEAVLPGFIDAQIGRDILVRDTFLRRSNLMVTQREHVLGENGASTRLTLQSAVYYD